MSTSSDIAEIARLGDRIAAQTIRVSMASSQLFSKWKDSLLFTMEFVKVAGTAISIHQTMRVKNSLPFPLTRALTMAPSISATRTLIKVLRTKKKLWLASILASLLRQPGTTILVRRIKDLKNSRFRATFFLGVSSEPAVTVPWRAAR